MSRHRKEASLVPGRRPAGVSRPVQVAEQVRQALSMMLSDGSIKDPRLGAAMVTITDVVMSPDLRSGRVFVSVFPEAEDVVKGVLAGLRSAAGELKRGLHDRLGLRHTPNLEFGFDSSIVNGAKIESILRDIKREDGEE